MCTDYILATSKCICITHRSLHKWWSPWGPSIVCDWKVLLCWLGWRALLSMSLWADDKTLGFGVCQTGYYLNYSSESTCTALCLCNTKYEFCFLAAVAIDKGGLGPVQECWVVFTSPIKSVLLFLVCMTCVTYMYITCRLVHGFTCAGVLPTQYINFARFADLGRMGHAYIRQGNQLSYMYGRLLR